MYVPIENNLDVGTNRNNAARQLNCQNFLLVKIKLFKQMSYLAILTIQQIYIENKDRSLKID